MLILPQNAVMNEMQELKQGLLKQFNDQLEDILNKNAAKDKYWILGRVKFPEEYQGRVGKTFLEACEEKPPLTKNAFLYEVDNRQGTKTILWVMNPDDSLRLPTINRTLHI